MSNAGHFNSKHVQEAKKPKFFEDFSAKKLRHSDGSHALYRGGKVVPGSHSEPKKEAKRDVPSGESKFYKATEVSTLVERTRGEKETAGESGLIAHVRKKIDVNARAMKL